MTDREHRTFVPTGSKLCGTIPCSRPSGARPEGFPVLFQVDYSDHAEYYIYPFKEEYNGKVSGEVVDLDLTAIVNAFIGNEYI